MKVFNMRIFEQLSNHLFNRTFSNRFSTYHHSSLDQIDAAIGVH